MTITTAKRQAVARDITVNFDLGYEGARPVYPRLAYRRKSTRREEKYSWIGKMPRVREWIGDRQFSQLAAYDYSLKNKDWESGFEIDKNDISDDENNQYGDIARQLGIEAGYHPDELLFDTIRAGTTELCFDGQPFYDTNHNFGVNSKAPAAQSNRITRSGTTAPADPTFTEFKGAVNEGQRVLQSFIADNGTYFNRALLSDEGGNMTLIYPPNMHEVADEYYRSDLVNGGNSNVISYGRPTRMQAQYLTTEPTVMYLNVTTGLFRAFVFQDRMKMMRQVKGSDDIEYKENKFMTWARYNVGYLFWWLSVRIEFTA